MRDLPFHESIILFSDNILERSDRKISAHATLETPPARGNLTPLPEKEKQPSRKQQTPTAAASQPMVREASDLDVRRRNKGKVSEEVKSIFIS